MDDNGNGSLDWNEFRKGIKEMQLGVTDMQIRHLFNLFDANDDGAISYEEFLVGLRGELNERRRAMVEMAFRRLDKDGSGVVDMLDIRALYNARGHRDVLSRVRTEEEVLREVRA